MCLYQLKGDELKLYDSQSEEIIRPVKAKAFIFMLLSLQGVLITIRKYRFHEMLFSCSSPNCAMNCSSVMIGIFNSCAFLFFELCDSASLLMR